MSFPKTLSEALLRLGCEPAGRLAFWLPGDPGDPGEVRWHIGFRALGFAKDQIDAALRYRHPQATDFAWACLTTHAGPRWRQAVPAEARRLSAGFAVGPLAGWRSDHRFDNRGLSPEQAAQRVASDIEGRVLPFTARHARGAALLQLLLQDDEPFPWYRAQPLLRLAEVAWFETALQGGVDGQPRAAPSSLPALADRHRAMLEDQLDGVPVADYLARVLHAAQAA